jgi:hypothetical protein
MSADNYNLFIELRSHKRTRWLVTMQFVEDERHDEDKGVQALVDHVTGRRVRTIYETFTQAENAVWNDYTEYGNRIVSLP